MRTKIEAYLDEVKARSDAARVECVPGTSVKESLEVLVAIAECSDFVPRLERSLRVALEALSRCNGLVPNNLMMTEMFGHVVVPKALKEIEFILCGEDNL
jgi:hypothetical protein